MRPKCSVSGQNNARYPFHFSVIAHFNVIATMKDIFIAFRMLAIFFLQQSHVVQNGRCKVCSLRPDTVQSVRYICGLNAACIATDFSRCCRFIIWGTSDSWLSTWLKLHVKIYETCRGLPNRNEVKSMITSMRTRNIITAVRLDHCFLFCLLHFHCPNSKNSTYLFRKEIVLQLVQVCSLTLNSTCCTYIRHVHDALHS